MRNIGFFHVHSDTAVDPDAKTVTYSLERPHFIEAVTFLPINPADADTDTVAVDVSYSIDGFSASDVEVAALAAVEYNDTTSTGFTQYTPKDIALTTASLTAGTSCVRIPAGALVKVVVTWTGAPADGAADVVVQYRVI